MKTGSNIVLSEDFRRLKTEYFMLCQGLTAGEAIMLGLACNELTVGEIAECIEADGPLDRNDNLPRERAERPVWVLHERLAGHNLASGTEFTIEGKWTEKPWTFSHSDGWTWFAYNRHGAALDGGATVKIYAVHYGVWVT